MTETISPNTPALNTKAKRAQLDHVLLDVDFFDKPKNKELLFKFGHSGLLYLIRLYALMSRATDGVISIGAAQAVAWEMRVEKCEEILDFCLQDEMITRDGDKIFSYRVVKDQEKLAASRDAWNDKNRARKEKTQSILRVNSEYGESKKGVSTELHEQLNTELMNNEVSKVLEGGAGGNLLPESRGRGVWLTDLVFLNEIENEQIQNLYKAQNLNEKDVFAYAVSAVHAHIKRNPSAKNMAFDAFSRFGLKEAMSFKQQKIQLETAQKRAESNINSPPKKTQTDKIKGVLTKILEEEYEKNRDSNNIK